MNQILKHLFSYFSGRTDDPGRQYREQPLFPVRMMGRIQET